MEWLIILALGVWVWLQAQRIGRLEQRLKLLEAPGAAAPAFAAKAAPAADEQEALLLDKPLADDDREPLLLDTPLPPVSNDTDAPPLPGETPVLETPVLETLVPEAAPAVAAPTVAPAAATAAVRPKRTRRNFEQWLSREGIAWLAGVTLSLGAISFVSVGAQQGWFTPALQLAAGAALGLAMLAASEWMRRAGTKQPPANTLVAGLLSGAGIVALYATVWVAHGVYHFIAWPMAGVLLTLCAALLVGLSFLHGQGLAVLAIVAALLAPAFASGAMWPNSALTFYICAVGAAGFAVAWVRRWAVATCATILGLYFWFAGALALDDGWRGLALICFATLGGLATAQRAPLAEEAPGRFTWTNAQLLLPTMTVCISTTFLIFAWITIVKQPAMPIAGPALVGLAHIALAAVAVRRRAIEPMALAIAIGGLVTGFGLYLRARHFFAPLDQYFYFWILFAPIVVAFSALGARPNRHGRVLVAAAGAIGAGLLYLLAAAQRQIWESPQVWAPLFIGAALLFIGAILAARDAGKPEADWAVDAWAGSAAVLALVGIESAFASIARAPADAAAAVLFVFLLNRRAWRATRLAALAAAAVAIGHALSSDLVGAALDALLPMGNALALLGAAAALLLAASMLARRDANTREALSSASLIVMLIGVFLALRWITAGGGTSHLSAFAELALRTLTLMSTGLIVLPRPAQTPGPIAAWRAHVLIGLGILSALTGGVFFFNPWWGEAPAAVAGPALFNDIALAFAAPALLLAYAARRLYAHKRNLARVCAVFSGLFGLDWAVLELRRAFHPAAMASAPVGVFEAACYSLVLLAAALAVAVAARRRRAKSGTAPFTQDLGSIANAGVWVALIAAGYILLVTRHPWWGAQIGADSNALSTGLAVLAQAWACTLALGLGRAVARTPGVDTTRFAAAAGAALLAWSFGHAAIRWLYHGAAMDDGAPNAGLEGYAHALWPLALVVAGAEITKRAPGHDSVRAYLRDLQAIWAVAVWPAAIFAALGLWLIYAPWWGLAPVQVGGFAVALGIAAPVGAALLTLRAQSVAHLKWSRWFGPAALALCIGHALLAAMLLVRWSFHGGELNATAPAEGLELWTYSGVLAVMGGGLVALGASREAAMLHRIGLALLFVTAAKVGFIDMARLGGLLQSASLLGLGAVATLVAWGTRRIGLKPSPVGPGPMPAVSPGVRHESQDGPR